MKYNALKETGEKIYEEDFYQNNLYAWTREIWIAEGALYIHDNHPNQLNYTGDTKTWMPSILEAKYIVEQELPEKISKICIEKLDNQYFSNRSKIKKFREKAGLTQEEFSKIFEIPIDTVKNWDSGRRSPSKWAEKLIIEKLEQMKGQ